MSTTAIVCIVIVILLVIILVSAMIYYLFFRQLYHSDYVVTGNVGRTPAKNLMIVAHPDDEVIFGGKLLFSGKWKVVCVTNASDKSGFPLSRISGSTRRQEFINVMNTYGHEYELWDYEDNGLNTNWHPSLKTKLSKLLSEHKYKLVVTHNLEGEYGHLQHKRLSELVHQLQPRNLHVFNYNTSIYPLDIEFNPYLQQLNPILNMYSTQINAIKKFYTNILYQSVRKVYF